MASNENLEHKEFNSFDEDLIDLRNIVYLIIKNNKLIGLFLIFGIFIGSIVAISHKNIWQGNFQIVLDNKKSDPIGLESLSNNTNVLLNISALNIDRQVLFFYLAFSLNSGKQLAIWINS